MLHLSRQKWYDLKDVFLHLFWTRILSVISLRLFGIGILLNVRSQLVSLLYVNLYNLQLFSAFDFFLGKKVYSSVEHRYLPVYVHFSVCVNHAACLLKVFLICNLFSGVVWTNCKCTSVNGRRRIWAKPCYAEFVNQRFWHCWKAFRGTGCIPAYQG